jgi:tetratricopeptide (TPR) repeat protein
MMSLMGKWRIAANRSIQLDPKLSWGYYARGNVYQSKRDYDRAIADYTEAIRLSSRFYQAYFLRAYIYSEKNDFDRAIADYTEVIRIDPQDGQNGYKFWAYNNRGLIYEKKIDYNRAIADYEAALRIDPNNSTTKNNLANAKNKSKSPNSNTARNLNNTTWYSSGSIGVPQATLYFGNGNFRLVQHNNGWSTEGTFTVYGDTVYLSSPDLNQQQRSGTIIGDSLSLYYWTFTKR